MTTPAAWKGFTGRRIGSTTAGIAAAFCPTALLFGFEIITGASFGIGLGLGPVWLGIAILKPAQAAALKAMEESR